MLLSLLPLEIDIHSLVLLDVSLFLGSTWYKIRLILIVEIDSLRKMLFFVTCPLAMEREPTELFFRLSFLSSFLSSIIVDTVSDIIPLFFLSKSSLSVRLFLPNFLFLLNDSLFRGRFCSEYVFTLLFFPWESL